MAKGLRRYAAGFFAEPKVLSEGDGLTPSRRPRFAGRMTFRF
jgi:hypothetical protein